MRAIGEMFRLLFRKTTEATTTSIAQKKKTLFNFLKNRLQKSTLARKRVKLDETYDIDTFSQNIAKQKLTIVAVERTDASLDATLRQAELAVVKAG